MDPLLKLYKDGMKVLREHHEEICHRVMASQRLGKGNFGYLEDKDIKREMDICRVLTSALWRINVKILGKAAYPKNLAEVRGWGSSIDCVDCIYKRFNFHSKREPNHWCNEQEEGWYCQGECEEK